MKDMKIKCYKGAGKNDCTEIEIDENAMLVEVREKLLNAGFITPDTADKAYRFIYRTDEKENPQMIWDDVIVSINMEKRIPMQDVWGMEHQIVVTNINAQGTEKPDLVGYTCKQWLNGLLSVSCKLNNSDHYAKEQNKKIGAYEPMMLYDVISTSKAKPVSYNNVCICTEGSVVEFNITSWGAAGYEYQICNDAGQVIVESIFQTFNDDRSRFGTYGTLNCRRWQKSGNTIDIYGSNSVHINNDEKVRYQKLTIKTRNLISYKRGNELFQSDAKPPVLKAPMSRSIVSRNPANEIKRQIVNTVKNHVGVVDGDSISTAVPVEGGKSTQTYGSINSTVTGPWEEPLGIVEIHFFVFKTKEEAERTLKCLNSINPDFWD